MSPVRAFTDFQSRPLSIRSKNRLCIRNSVMSRDSNATYLHFHASHHADLLEDFTQSKNQLPVEDIYVPDYLQPLNPEDEDDVVPDQHAAFGIQRATQAKKKINWRDLGLEELAKRAPADGTTTSANAGPAGAAPRRTALQNRDEPVSLALRRRPGAGTAAASMSLPTGGAQPSAGGVGNGLPR
ncbi:Apc13p-domain-containing protein [Bimuria novae-zelandiae CBS 107.79]|uniref:Apc13p-domain-containing protein n=1 Tax=Bimuria novae-zelandiae CBS 107.79 TaxID=1447943 RepID=A0A6A5V075_9PLEO|nr:Apc13p-domain-containing protein [Bimuria novae-zelandiae CBS 107.79]